jgi:hypothetical protein
MFGGRKTYLSLAKKARTSPLDNALGCTGHRSPLKIKAFNSSLRNDYIVRGLLDIDN